MDVRNSRAVGIWLLIGAGMIVVQIVLGGITRLTESGLSITEWKPITGALPPLNEGQWQIEFSKYKNTDQFRYIHADFSLSDFKFIFFWEWLHRLWARLLGIVFLIGFFYFLIRRKFSNQMIIPLVILFLLGALQGAVGWIMVRSGLVPERLFVGHIQLATHFIAALLLLCYTLWFSWQLLIKKNNLVYNSLLKKTSIFIFSLLVIQLIYGAFMAGLKAATAAPTWPDINGYLFPPNMNTHFPWFKNLINNKITVQFIHRAIAYLLALSVLIWTFKAKNIKGIFFKKILWWPLTIVLLQVILGILTVLKSPYGNNLVWFGVAHQFTAIIFLSVMLWIIFIVRSKPAAY